MLFLNRVILKFGSAEALPLRVAVAKALFNEGLTFDKHGRLEDAPEPVFLAVVAESFVNKAIALYKLGQWDQTVETCDEIIFRFSGDQGPLFTGLVAWARNWVAILRHNGW